MIVIMIKMMIVIMIMIMTRVMIVIMIVIIYLPANELFIVEHMAAHLSIAKPRSQCARPLIIIITIVIMIMIMIVIITLIMTIIMTIIIIKLLSIKVFLTFPVALVNPSGAISVIPSVGFSPNLLTAIYINTC